MMSRLPGAENAQQAAEFKYSVPAKANCHGLIHVICRRLYPDDTDALRDGPIGDEVGLYAAFGCFEPETEKLTDPVSAAPDRMT